MGTAQKANMAKSAHSPVAANAIPETSKLLRRLSKHSFFHSRTLLSLSPLETQGHCNHTFLLRGRSQHYIVRYYLSNIQCMSTESYIQNLVHSYSLAAKSYYFDPYDKIMVSEFIPGKHKTTLTQDEILILATSLSRMHRIKTTEIPTTILPSKTSPRKQFDYAPVLCHNDLNPKNIIWDKEKVTLIDWEYAGINDRYFDLASAIVEFDLNDRQSDLFLKTYFANQSEANRDKLLAYQTHYQEVCEQWWQDKEKSNR